MSIRYWSTQRPVDIGTYPKPKGNDIVNIVNFDERCRVTEIGRMAWGYIEYAQALPEGLAEEYELISEADMPPYMAIGNVKRREYAIVPRETVCEIALEESNIMLLDEGLPYRLFVGTTNRDVSAIGLIVDAFGVCDLKAAHRAWRVWKQTAEAEATEAAAVA